jgi:DNA-binding transcriptional ArsR family regulator
MKMMEWVRLPSDWINHDYGLREFQWKTDSAGSDATAALMTLTAIAHHADTPNGIARLTYNTLCFATGISRAKLSNGLDVLEKHRVIERMPEGRSTYRLRRFNPPAKWGKLPAQRMYASGRITVFKDFGLRKEIELNALKLFLLLVALAIT